MKEIVLTNKVRISTDFHLNRCSLLDVSWHWEHGKLWDIHIDILKVKIVIWLQGDDLPF